MKGTMPEQAAKLRADFARAGAVMTTALQRGLLDAGLIVQASAQKNLTDGQHISTGLLRASVTHRLIDFKRVQVGTNVPYAHDLEFGSAPHRVPIGDLLKWARRKFGDESIAYAVQKSIEKKGTRPHPFLIPALNSNRTRIFSAVKSSLRKGIDEAAKK